jgi:rod shape determining protein RodA
LASLALLGIGLINLFSTSGGELSFWNSFSRQLIFTGFALLLLSLSLFFDYSLLKYVSWPLYFLSIVLVILVKYYGIKVNGALRWLPLFTPDIRFQPSEIMKIAVVVALAGYLSSKPNKNGLGLMDLLFPTILVGLPFYVILKQPDMGTALHIALTVVPIFILRKIRLWVLITVVTIFMAAFSWLFFFGGLNFLLEKKVVQGYHLDRYENFLKEKDPTGKGWQITQAKNAIGSGQVNGRGYMEGSQQKHGFLPAAQTDFAFAALAEEWGFVGAVSTLALFFILIWSSLSAISRCRDSFGSLLIVGMSSLIFFQMIINVAMVTDLIPVVGIPLPFISYGGTSVVINIMCVAVVLNVSMRPYKFAEAPIAENPLLWESPPQNRLVEESGSGVRRLLPHDPKEPDLHPPHRLPHFKPWLKHFATKNWVNQQLLEPEKPR